jgi:chromosome segregation ATPase
MKVEKTPRGPKNQGLLDPRDQMAELKKVIEFSGEEQVQMMMNLLNFYESENMKLKEEAQIKETSNKNLVRRINEKETERRNLTKRVSKLEDFLKLERRANEGMRKKVQHFESENYQVEDQRNEMRDSQARLREKLAEYEVTFNRDRSKLLKTMHENDVLQSRNQDLDDRACQAEAELVGSREKAFNYLRQIETLNGKLDYQNNLINAQAREMAAIQGELNDLKIRHSRLSEENVQHLHEIGEPASLNATELDRMYLNY